MLAGLMKFLGALMGFFESRQLLEAGKAQEALRAERQEDAEVKVAEALRADFRNKPASELRDDDGFRR